MPFQPFTPPEHHHELVVYQHPTPRPVVINTTTRPVRRHLPRWATWLIGLAVFVILWWVSMDFRGLVMVLGVFWFFAFGAHPLIHLGRAAHDLIDGDN